VGWLTAIWDFISGGSFWIVGIATVAGLFGVWGIKGCTDQAQEYGKMAVTAEVNAHSVDEVRHDKEISDKVTTEQGAESDEIRREIDADRTEVSRPVDWRALVLPADVLRVFGYPDSPAGGDGTPNAAGGAAARSAGARLAWEY
jgi:hypothetical protein